MAAEVSKQFFIPSGLHAAEPPEMRGIKRDQVKLMVTDKHTGEITHDSFSYLDRYLQKGDLLILNNSRTIPAVLYSRITHRNGINKRKIEIRLARKTAANSWNVLIFSDGITIGDKLTFNEQLEAVVVGSISGSPLWKVCFNGTEHEIFQYILENGEPIHYEYSKQPWELNYYQTVFASVPGSVEMPSAGRAFSWEMLFRIQRKGIKIGYIQLHTGLSYMTEEHWPIDPKANPEFYHVPCKTLEMVHETKAAGQRVIAVGTTVVRSLETVADTNVLSGMTNLYIGADHTLSLIDGIITGFHEPEASHLDLLSSFINKERLLASYQRAIDYGYLWHEFGDMNLII